jgi:Tfp pilus assembly protein PilV
LSAPLSTVVAALRRRHQLVRNGGERGTSLIELLVGMLIMTVCGGIFLGAAVTLSRVTAKTQSVTASASQTNLAYLSVDRIVRYASAVSPPGKSGTGRWYVELRDTTSGSEVCTQLRIDNSTKQLQRRTWSTADMTTLTPFRQISTGFTNTAADDSDESDDPFVLVPNPLKPPATPPSTASANHPRLIVTLTAAAGSSDTSSTSKSSFTLTALNSTLPAPTGPICQQAGRP